MSLLTPQEIDAFDNPDNYVYEDGHSSSDTVDFPKLVKAVEAAILNKLSAGLDIQPVIIGVGYFDEHIFGYTITQLQSAVAEVRLQYDPAYQQT